MGNAVHGLAQYGWLKPMHAKASSPVTDDEEEMEEDNIRGFSLGLNLGSYFTFKKSANF